MSKLTEKQIKTLELFRKGKSYKEIGELTHFGRVDDAIERGKANVNQAIETLRVAINRSLMSEEQLTKVKQLLRKL